MRWIVLALVLMVTPARATIVSLNGGEFFSLPQSGLIQLDSPVAGFNGTFRILNPLIPLSGVGYAETSILTSVNGEGLDYFQSYGCSLVVNYCGRGPFSTDNFYGTHRGLGSSFFRTTSADNTVLIVSTWSAHIYEGNFLVPNNYEVALALSFPVLASATPEPSTWAMMILGFAGVGFMAYRRKLRPALMAT